MLPKCSLVNLIPEFLFQRTKAAGAKFSFICRCCVLPLGICDRTEFEFQKQGLNFQIFIFYLDQEINLRCYTLIHPYRSKLKKLCLVEHVLQQVGWDGDILFVLLQRSSSLCR